MDGWETALVAARWLLLVAELQVFGALLAYRLIGPFPLWRLLRPAALALAGFGVAWFALQAMVIDDPATPLASIALVLQDSWVGHVAAARALFWALSLLAARRWPGLAILPAAVALGLHGAVGHAEASGEPWLWGAMVLHVLAAGAWLGGLLPLRLALAGPNPTRAALRFAQLGTVCVSVLAVTAFGQSVALAGSLPALVGTDYGRMLLVKLGLFLLLVALAARNRFVLTPRLAADPGALNRSLTIEILTAAGLLMAASLLSSLAPAAHQQPDWPFPLRVSLDVLNDDDLRAEILRALLLLAGAAVAVVLATLHRRLRIAGLLVAVALAWFALPSLRLLLVPAEPTYYWQSDSAGDARSVALGAVAYARHCVLCHGTGARGDGRLAAALPEPPADLTAPHLWEHSDGELYWWINHGMRDPDGHVVMPGLGKPAGSQQVWNLIDFLHASNRHGQFLPATAHHHH